MGSFEGSLKIAYILTAFATCSIVVFHHANATHNEENYSKIEELLKEQTETEWKAFVEENPKIWDEAKTKKQLENVEEAKVFIKKTVGWDEPIKSKHHDEILRFADKKLKESKALVNDAEKEVQEAIQKRKDAKKVVEDAQTLFGSAMMKEKEKADARQALEKKIAALEMVGKELTKITNAEKRNQQQEKGKIKGSAEPHILNCTNTNHSLVKVIQKQMLFDKIKAMILKFNEVCDANTFLPAMKDWSQILYLSKIFHIEPQNDKKKLGEKQHSKKEKQLNDYIQECINGDQLVYNQLIKKISEEEKLKLIKMIREEIDQKRVKDHQLEEKIQMEEQKQLVGGQAKSKNHHHSIHEKLKKLMGQQATEMAEEEEWRKAHIDVISKEVDEQVEKKCEAMMSKHIKKHLQMEEEKQQQQQKQGLRRAKQINKSSNRETTSEEGSLMKEGSNSNA